MRRAHHYAFEHGLAADQSFFAAFEGGKKLDGSQKSQIVSQRYAQAIGCSFRRRRRSSRIPQGRVLQDSELQQGLSGEHTRRLTLGLQRVLRMARSNRQANERIMSALGKTLRSDRGHHQEAAEDGDRRGLSEIAAPGGGGGLGHLSFGTAFPAWEETTLQVGGRSLWQLCG